MLDTIFAQSAGVVEDTDCFNAEGEEPRKQVSWIWH